MAVTIRPFEPDDLSAVVALFRDTVHRVAARDYPPDQLEAWAPAGPDLEAWRRRLASGFTVVAMEGEHVLGFANLALGGAVDCLYANADRQRAGIGGALLGEQPVERRGVRLVNLRMTKRLRGAEDDEGTGPGSPRD